LIAKATKRYCKPPNSSAQKCTTKQQKGISYAAALETTFLGIELAGYFEKN
jgi:hypothetical protein